MQKWIRENDRLSITSIFGSLDRGNFGELKPQDFLAATARIGIRLDEAGYELLKAALDPNKLGFIKYTPLVMQLKGVPMTEFVRKELLGLAQEVVEHDLLKSDFKKAFESASSSRSDSMGLQDFNRAMAKLGSIVERSGQ